MTDREIAEIKRKWDAGVSISRIAKTMPYKETTALQYIWDMKRQGILPERPRKNGRELVIAAYKNGMHNPYEIAETYGYTYQTVRSWLSSAKLNRPRPEHNWKAKPKGKKTKEILKCLESGIGMSETARRFGVSRQWVYEIKKGSEKNGE